MTIGKTGLTLLEISKATMIIFVGAIVVPVVVGLACGVSPGVMLGLASSVILFQALAAVVGLSLTIHPAFVLVVMTSVALTIILTIFEVCDTFAHRSTRVQGSIGKMKNVSDRSDTFHKYGELALFPIIWIPGIGLFGCALIAWIFQWRGPKAILLMLMGWMVATLVVMLASLGIVSLVF